MGSEQKEDISDTNSVSGEMVNFEETIAELKQNKARAKMAFTKCRRHLLVVIQEEITIEEIDEECEQLNVLIEEALELMLRLSTKYKLERDIKSNEKLSLEIEQIKIEFTDAQNRAQRVRDELSNRKVYSKFVEQLNRGQSVPVDNKVDSLTMQCNSKVLEKTERPEIKNGIQSPVHEIIGQQFEFKEKQPILTSNSGSHKVETQLEHGEICEPSGATHTVRPQIVTNRQSAAVDIVNRGN